MTRITRTTAAVLALATIAVPTASASVADKPVHHARAGEYVRPTDLVPSSSLKVAPQDLRTPDAIDAAPAQDIRTADARDAADGRGA
jgi:hypothetical protein